MELNSQNIKNSIFNRGPSIKPSRLNLFLAILAILIAIPASPTPFVYAGPPKFSEYKMKSMFIYNFTKFIRWPGNAKAAAKKQELNFCVAGDDPFGNYLVEMGKAFRSKGITFIVNRGVSFDEIPKCKILFIAKSAKPLLNKILKKTGQLPVLVVSDSPGFAQRGVGINFYMQKGKIRFEINRNAIKAAGLRVSSELLKRALIVGGNK